MENDNKQMTTISLPARIDAKQYGVDLGEEDLIVPRLTLVQPTSKVDGAGKYNYIDGLHDSVDCVMFSNQRGRVMFDPDMTKQQSICGSDDRLVPSPRFEHPKATRCGDCNFQRREYKEKVIVNGKEVDLQCQMTMVLKGMFVDNLLPFIISFRRTSLLPINEWLSIMQFECSKYKKPLCCFPIRLKTNLVQKVNQKYYVPTIEKLGMIEREEFLAMMNKYKDYDPNKTFEQEEKQGKPVNDEEGTPF